MYSMNWFKYRLTPFYFSSGEIEELKQDLSSFRFEVLNTLQTQQKSLQEAINLVSAKLDLVTRLHVSPSSDLFGGPRGSGGGGGGGGGASHSPPSDNDYSPGSGKRYLATPSPMYACGYESASPISQQGSPGPAIGFEGIMGGSGGRSPPQLLHHGGFISPPTTSSAMEYEAPLMTENEPAILSRGIVHEYRGESADTALMEDEDLHPEVQRGRPSGNGQYPSSHYGNGGGAATIGVSSSTTSDAQVPGHGYRRDKRASVIEGHGAKRSSNDEGSGGAFRGRKESEGSRSNRSGSQTPKTSHSPPSPSSSSTAGRADWEPTYLSGSGYKPDVDNYINLLESSSSTS